MRCLSLPVTVLVAVSLAGCTHRPTIAYPKLVEAGPIEAGFDCAALDDAILKTEAVRWVMREDGARLLSPKERVGRTATDVATSVAAAAACFLCLSPVYLGEEGHKALDSADHRLLSLLKLKKSKACAARPTGISNMTDLDLHETVAKLLAEEVEEKPSAPVGELRAERMRLLDGLRP